MNPHLPIFLMGVLATCFLVASLFFLRFWRDTRDSLFLAFALSFLIEGLNRIALLGAAHPNEGRVWTYLVRLLATLIILGAIVRKNYGRSR